MDNAERLDNKEELNQRKPRRVLIILLVVAIVFGLSTFILRGAYISNTLRSAIVPELEEMTGKKIGIRKIYLNLLPLYIQGEEISVTDENNAGILNAKRVKGYIDLSGLLNRNIVIRRLVVRDPEIVAERKKIEEIISRIKTYLEKERKSAFKVKFKVVEIANGRTRLADEDLQGMMNIKGFSGEVIIGESQRIRASVKELGLEKEGWPGILCNVNTAVLVKNDRIEIKRLEVGAYGSKLKTEGTYSQGSGRFKTDLELIVSSVKRLFGLREKGDGEISAKGEIRIEKNVTSIPSIRAERPGPLLRLQSDEHGMPDLGDVFLDLKLSGEFYIQALMELLKVSDRIEGLVDFQGELRGPLTDFAGKARAELVKGNLYNVDVDSLQCNIVYKDGVMKFENGYGVLYNGTANVDASIPLPVVDSFTLNVKFTGADSQSAFKLIGWDPGIPAGKVDGELSSTGNNFSPDGWFVYKALSSEQRARMNNHQPMVDNVLNRIRDTKGNYSLREGILSFSSLQISTPYSNVSLKGTVDIAKKALDMKSRLYSENVTDLTLPYYEEAKGKAEFYGEISGTFDDPKISGGISLTHFSIEEYKSDSISADISYRKELLEIHESVLKSSGEEHRLKGKIFFPDAGELFDLSRPTYDLRASVRNAEFGKAVQIFYRDFQGTGRMNADISIGGRDPEIEIWGKGTVEGASAYSIPFDFAEAAFTYAGREFTLKKTKVSKGRSVLFLDGKILPDNKFSFHADSQRVFIRDAGLARMPEDVALSLQAEGHGTFDNPFVTLDAKVSGGTFRGINMGRGLIKAAIRNRDVSVDAALFNERVNLKGQGYLDDRFQWSAKLSVQQGRYDFLVSSILKDVPEDLQLDLEGHAAMEGDRNNIHVSADVSRLKLSLFEQTFTNDSNIRFLIDNKKVSIGTFEVKSGATAFRIHGSLEIGQEYNVHLEGSSSLAPLKGLSERIGYLKGDADFKFAVTGNWEKPEINGGMNVANGAFGFRDFPNYVSSINGYLYVDGDRIVLEKLSGKIGGGDVKFSGFVYLAGFKIKNFFVEALLDNITPALSRDFSINFSGDIVYKGTLKAQNITGDVKINRAVYRQQIQWRSWLLQAKSIEKPRVESSFIERAELNIRISGSDNIAIDNNIVRAPVSIRGGMIIKGTLSDPVLFGRLETTEGTAHFKNNEFKIIYASLDFADPHRIKPVINLTAETVIQRYNIRLSLEGQMEQFNLALSSDPHLEEVDILALLTVGQFGKELKGLEGGIGAGEATSFLTGKVQDVLEERLRTVTGLDMIHVEPNISKTTSSVSPRATVSERLLGDKVYVTYSTFWDTQVEEVLKIEYILGKNVSLEGVRDEQGSLGGDIKFRFKFK